MDLNEDGFEERQEMIKRYIYEVEIAPSMQQLLQLQRTLLRPENQLFLDKYRGKYLQMARIYTAQLHRKMKQKSKMQEMTNIQYEQEMKLLTNSQLFDYLVEFEQAEYAHFLQQLRGQVKTDRKMQQPNQSNLQLFLNNYELMNETCVGCNKFFYRYFPLQFIINPKSIPVEFLYHFDMTLEEQMEDLDCSQAGSSSRIEVPARSMRIDLNHILESKENLLRVILKFMNEQGGFIMIGCKKLTHFEEFRQIINNWRLRIMRQVHFYVGNTINHQLQLKIRKQIEDIIKDIQPAVLMDQNIEINFVPVYQSSFVLSFGLNQPKQSQESWKNRHLYVVVIKIKPTQFCPHSLSKTKTENSSNNLPLQFQHYQSSEEEQDYNSYYSFAQLNAHAEGLSPKQINQQAWMVKNTRNLFQTHDCTI